MKSNNNDNYNNNKIPVVFYFRKNRHWQDKVSTKYCVKSTRCSNHLSSGKFKGYSLIDKTMILHIIISDTISDGSRLIYKRRYIRKSCHW